MKILSRIAPLLAAMLMMAACERGSDQPTPALERTIVYSVDATEHRAVTHTEAEWQALLDRFCNYAEAGSTVSFRNANRTTQARATKDAVEYSTTSREEMKAWMRQMEAAGRTVTISYDRETGTWHGIAYAVAPQPSPWPQPGETATYCGTIHAEADLVDYVFVTLDGTSRTVYANYCTRGWLHMGGGVFADVREEGGRLILNVAEAYTNPSTFDTLYLQPLGGDTLALAIASGNGSSASTAHSCLLTPAPAGISAWHCSSPYDIVLHLAPSAAETYPAMGAAQVWSEAERVNCIGIFYTGNYELMRRPTSLPSLEWELTMHALGSGEVIDSLGVNGYPDPDAAASTMTVFDLQQYPGCASQYVFHRID